jgi:predicted MFS family arabinose efflux permease
MCNKPKERTASFTMSAEKIGIAIGAAFGGAAVTGLAKR